MNFGAMQAVVAAGYDLAAERYESWAARIYSPERERVTRLLIETLPPGSHILELGCGNGEPTARILSAHFDLTAVDFSQEQLRRARRVVPGATFIQDDMAAVSFSPESFAAVVALFSIIHVPCEDHERLFHSVHAWLQPGGVFVFNSGANASHRGYEEDWLGAPMFWSHHAPETTRRLALAAGFELQSQRVETINEGHGPATFVWWTAVKPKGECCT